MNIPTLAEFEDAAAVLDDVVVKTPFDVSEHLTDVLGAPVYLKLENLQRTGSFKIRGATYRLSRLTAEERARGVVAAIGHTDATYEQTRAALAAGLSLFTGRAAAQTGQRGAARRR